MDNNVSDALFSEAVSKLNPSNSDLFEEIAVEKEVPLQVRCTAIGRLNFADHSIELIDFASDKEQDVSIRMAAVENFGMDCDGILEPLIVDRGETQSFAFLLSLGFMLLMVFYWILLSTSKKICRFALLLSISLILIGIARF